MTFRTALLRVTALALLAAAIAPQVPPTANSKIDPAVQAALDSGQTVSVIVLGATQLFPPVGGLESFALAHAKDDRRRLRRTVIDSLKRLASVEQQRILRALKKSAPERSLWVMNAMVLPLTPDEIRQAAAMSDVAFIYPSREQLRVPDAAPAAIAVAPVVKREKFTTKGKQIGWNVERLGAPRVWRELDVTGEGVLVTSIDFGANYMHHDLRASLWRNAREIPNNLVDDDRNGYVDDVYGYDFINMNPGLIPQGATPQAQHGTLTSGIIVGDGTGGTITGVAPRARLMPLIASGITNCALAYEYALENGADVISMSFSIPNLGNIRGLWRMMSDHAVAAGAVLVGGAGNFRTNAPLPYQHQSPKDVPSVISVAGVDSAMVIAPFSSAGPAEWGTVALYGDYPLPSGLIKPDVVAFPGPGYPLLSMSSDTGYVDPNTPVRGNSFSGPQGAGVAALMLSAAPALPAWRVRELFEVTARDLGPKGKDNDFGAGLLDAYAAVVAAKAAVKR
jgi:serine protease AprX